jgi:hypothetical protein
VSDHPIECHGVLWPFSPSERPCPDPANVTCFTCRRVMCGLHALAHQHLWTDLEELDRRVRAALGLGSLTSRTRR